MVQGGAGVSPEEKSNAGYAFRQLMLNLGHAIVYCAPLVGENGSLKRSSWVSICPLEELGISLNFDLQVRHLALQRKRTAIDELIETHFSLCMPERPGIAYLVPAPTNQSPSISISLYQPEKSEERSFPREKVIPELTAIGERLLREQDPVIVRMGNYLVNHLA